MQYMSQFLKNEYYLEKLSLNFEQLKVSLKGKNPAIPNEYIMQWPYYSSNQ